MANWTDIDTNNLLPGQPLTSPIVLALEENPRAIADGAAGAPKIADKTVAGAGIVTISGLDDFGGLWVRGYVSKSDTKNITFNIDLEYSTDDGSTFSSVQTLATETASGQPDTIVAVKIDTEFFVDFSSAAFKMIWQGSVDNGSFNSGVDHEYTAGTITGLDNTVTDIRISGLSVLFATPQGGESAV